MSDVVLNAVQEMMYAAHATHAYIVTPNPSKRTKRIRANLAPVFRMLEKTDSRQEARTARERQANGLIPTATPVFSKPEEPIKLTPDQVKAREEQYRSHHERWIRRQRFLEGIAAGLSDLYERAHRAIASQPRRLPELFKIDWTPILNLQSQIQNTAA